MSNPKTYSIVTLGSHSALQILKGAKDEGFKTIAVVKKGFEEPYSSFKVADEIISIDEYPDFSKLEQQLIDKNAILIPHVTLFAACSVDQLKDNKMPTECQVFFNTFFRKFPKTIWRNF